MSQKLFLTIFTTSVLLGVVKATCWTTGCQPDDWAVVGCSQYSMYECENERTTCTTVDNRKGKLYHCCNFDDKCPSSPGNPDPDDNDNAPINGITFEQFKQAVTIHGYPTPQMSQYQNFMNGAASKGQITTKRLGAMALTHLLHESDGLRARREYACEHTGCPGSYQTPGCDVEGQRYFGRGYIQLTWCYNYRPCSMDLFGDDRLVKNPDMVAQNENLCWDTAFWFWKVNVNTRPGVAEGRFGATTRAINGGLECDGGYQHIAKKRYEMYKLVRAAFGLKGPGIEGGCYN